MRRGLAIFLAGLVACNRTPPRDPDAPPDLLVVVVPSAWGAVPDGELAPHVLHFPQAQPVHLARAASWRALVTGQWPGTASSARPNTMQSVLGLYGYRTVGRVPALDLNDGTEFLVAGLDASPFASEGCLADHLHAFSSVHPEGADRAVFAVVAATRADCEPSADRAALVALLTGTKRDQLVVAVVSLDASDWRSAESSVPLYLAGPGIPSGERAGFASVVDVVPTLLAAGGAVVPSDATGTPLQPSPDRTGGPQVVFQQADGGTVGVRTPDHLLYLDGIDQPLPAEQPASMTPTVLLLHETAAPAADVVAPLYQALVQWDRQRRATSAADRMGSDAFRDMLRDQGYWH